MNTNGPIPHIFNGVSQQPASLRHTSQGEMQENAYSAISTGLRKRPPTKHVAKLTSSSWLTAHVHTINRDATERYQVIITNGDLFVFDLAGAAKTVSFPDGKGYLNCTTPRSDFAVLTVADYTFIANKTVSAAMQTDTTAGSVTGTKQKFSDLAAPTGSGNIFHISGDPSNGFDDYYVKDVSPDNVWAENTKPGVQYIINPATMPHKLVRNTDGTFTFSKVTWDNRLVGDDDSNPKPSFIANNIRDIYFHRNRLGFVSGEGFRMSRPGNYYNFWLETITAALDSDPVDTDVSHSNVSILHYAVPFNGALMLFSAKTQFQLTAPDAFTQRTAKADPVTDFEMDTGCRPIGIGRDLFFVTGRENYSGVREYYVEKDTVSNDAADITAHVSSYIPKSVFKMAACAVDDALHLLTLNERNAVYVYKYYWGDDKKVQSAWSKFTFDAGDSILNLDFIGQVGYMLVERSDGVYLETMDFQDNAKDSGFDFTILLDRRVSITGSYDSANNWTTWTLPYADNGEFQVILGSSFSSNKGVRLATSRPSSTTVRAIGDYSSGSCFVGRKYTKRYRFSELYKRDDSGKTELGGRLQIVRMFLNYSKSGYFRVEVTPKARGTYTYPFTGALLGDSSLVLGVPTLHSGVFKFSVQSNNLGLTIDIVNDSHLPSTIQSAEWEGSFTSQSPRP